MPATDIAPVVAERGPDRSIRLRGEFSLDNLQQLLTDSHGWFDSAQDVQIDLSEISRSDSSGVALLLEWMRRAKLAKCTLRYRNPSAQVQALMGFYHVDEFLLTK